MAVDALSRRYRVHSCELKSSSGVIEHGVGPQHGVVTGFAGRREADRDVIHRRRRIVVVGLVARDARCLRQVVVVIDVAIGALPRRRRVRSGQRESSAAVIKGCIQPRRRVVTLLAALREV